jgi:hypothetical protein
MSLLSIRGSKATKRMLSVSRFALSIHQPTPSRAGDRWHGGQTPFNQNGGGHGDNWQRRKALQIDSSSTTSTLTSAQQEINPPPLPNRVYQSNCIPTAPAPTTTVYPTPTAAYATATPVTTTAYIHMPTQPSSTAPVIAHVFVPRGQTPSYTTALAVESLTPPMAPSYNPAIANTHPVTRVKLNSGNENVYRARFPIYDPNKCV